IRYSMWFDRKEPGAPQFSREIEVGVTKEGEAFAAGAVAADAPKCILTGGAATMTVSYEGVSYPVCCTGCRDEFLENPAKYIKTAARRPRAGETPGAKPAKTSSVIKDDGAFAGLVDASAPAASSRRPSRSVAAPVPKAEEPAKEAEPAAPPSVKPAGKA